MVEESKMNTIIAQFLDSNFFIDQEWEQEKKREMESITIGRYKLNLFTLICWIINRNRPIYVDTIVIKKKRKNTGRHF